jgi:hypothetical protein
MADSRETDAAMPEATLDDEPGHVGISEGTVHEDGPAAGSRRVKPRFKRLAIVLGAIVLVFAAAGIGFGVWHEQPSFCNAFCHQPMDTYVAGYYSEQPGLLVAEHAATDISCLDCHQASLSEQISEGAAWLAGDFYMDEAGFIVSDDETDIGTRAYCFSCHDDGDSTSGKDWQAIVASTADWGGEEGVNPHQSHGVEEECSTCHSSHRTSLMACNSCHGWEVPEGWEQPKLY